MPANDAAGYDEFVRTRATALLRIAYLLTGEHHSAEDLLQEVLEQVFLHWRRIRGEPETYARRALVNRARSRWRSRRRRPEAQLREYHDLPAADRSEEVVRRHGIVAAVRELPDQQRAIVALRFLADLPVAEVAEIIGCTEGTVKSQTSRALAKLRLTLPARTALPS